MKSTLNFDAHSDSEHDDRAGLFDLLCIRGGQNKMFFKKLDVLQFKTLKWDKLQVFNRDTIDSRDYYYSTKNVQATHELDEKVKCLECRKLVMPSGIMCTSCDRVTCDTCDKKFQQSDDAIKHSGPCLCVDGDRKRISEVLDAKKLKVFDKVRLRCPYNPRSCQESF